MKVCAYIPLLYGKEYLAASIQSYMDLVDKIYVLYTPKPSYGYNAHLACPESEQELTLLSGKPSVNSVIPQCP